MSNLVEHFFLTVITLYYIIIQISEVIFMKKFTTEEEAYFLEKAEEAATYDEIHGGLTEEEFDAWLEKYEKEYEERSIQKLSKRDIKLNIPNFINKISKRFIRA